MRAAGTPLPAARRDRRAVYLDKDGTLVEDVPYNVDPGRLRFTPHAEEALRRLADAGFLLIVVSNQPGVALGRFGWADLERLAGALRERLAAAGVPLAGVYACPHAPAGTSGEPACGCRKPAPGLLLEAAREHGVDTAGSWMIGDILDDIEAGTRAGCRTVLLDVGSETLWQRSPLREPTHRAPNLLAAAEAILGERADTGVRLPQLAS